MMLSLLISLMAIPPNYASLDILFGNNWNDDWLPNIMIDPSSPNLWVQVPSNHKTTIPSFVIVYLNHFMNGYIHWNSWDTIWKLYVMPSVKTSIWKFAHRRLSTGAFLYDLNISPFTLHHFCGLFEEMDNHIIWNCFKVRHCWISTLNPINLLPIDTILLSFGL